MVMMRVAVATIAALSINNSRSMSDAFVIPSSSSLPVVLGGGRCCGVGSSSVVFLEPLAREGEWAAFLDEDNTDDVYYFNENTGESRWDPPTTTFPNVDDSANTVTSTRTTSSSSSSSSSSSEDGKKNVLGREGPWAAYMDETTTGMIYYFNSKTGESLWEAPTSTFPKIKMTKRAKEKMMTKRRAYAATLRTADSTTDATTDISLKKKKTEGGFFSNILQSSPTTTTTADTDTSSTDTLSSPNEPEPAVQETAVVADEVEESKKGNSGGAGGIFNIFSPSKMTTTTTTDSASTEPELLDTTPDVVAEEDDKQQNNNVFGFNLFGATSSTSTSTASTEPPQLTLDDFKEEEPVIAETPKQQQQQQQQIIKPVIASTTTEKKKKPVVVVEPKKKRPEPQPTIMEEKEEEPIATVPKTSGATTGFMNFFNPPAPKQIQVVEEEVVVLEEEDEAPVVVKPIKIEMAARVLPHPDKVSWGGEDAIFTTGRTFGVFDGVSGAEKEDGLPLYSVTLAQQMRKQVGNKKNSYLNIEEITAKMLQAAEYADDNATGASTSLVASIGDDGFLRLLNVGDCTALVIRDNRIVSRSKEVIHFFDCPYQLSIDSPDRPKNGSVLQTELIAGDIVVAGSDGVFDNLTDDLLIDTVSTTNKSSSTKAPLICKKIVQTARTISFDPQAQTPYAKLAKRKGYDDYRDGLGGKVDDICCIVVKVS